MYSNDDFKKYAINNHGVSSSLIDDATKGNMTPYILEERKMNVTQMDVFSRLMKDRIIWVSGEVNDSMSSIVSAQLMYLDNISEEDITLFIDSPGGSVKSGLTMVDVMNYIASDVSTVNMGMAASMGSILLGNGTVGKRSMLPNARVMLHQVSAGTQGHIADMKIRMEETEKYNLKLLTMLGEYTGKTYEQILSDIPRDLWLNAEESKEYGIIDEVITKKKK